MTTCETKKLNEDALFETLSRTFCKLLTDSVTSDNYEPPVSSYDFYREIDFLLDADVYVPLVVRKSLNGYRTHDHVSCRKTYIDLFGDVDKLFGDDIKENVIKAISFGIKLDRPSTFYSEITSCVNNQLDNWRISGYDSGCFRNLDRQTALVDLIGQEAYCVFNTLVSVIQRVYDSAADYPVRYYESVSDVYCCKGHFIKEMLDCDPEVFDYTHVIENPLYLWLRCNILRTDLSDEEAISFIYDLLKDIRKYKDLRTLNTI